MDGSTLHQPSPPSLLACDPNDSLGMAKSDYARTLPGSGYKAFSYSDCSLSHISLGAIPVTYHSHTRKQTMKFDSYSAKQTSTLYPCHNQSQHPANPIAQAIRLGTPSRHVAHHAPGSCQHTCGHTWQLRYLYMCQPCNSVKKLLI